MGGFGFHILFWGSCNFFTITPYLFIGVMVLFFIYLIPKNNLTN